MKITFDSHITEPCPLVTAAEMRECDASAARDYNIAGIVLMENAGRALFRKAEEMLRGVKGKSIAVICGGGNNGGDGFVFARHCVCAGADVDIVYFGNREKASSDSLANITAAERMNIPVLEDIPDKDYDLVVDCLLGTGITGDLRETSRDIIRRMNDMAGLKLSCDIPSGVNSDTGAVTTVAFKADATVTFALPKIGTVTYPGAAHCGELAVADITIPREKLYESRITRLITTGVNPNGDAKPDGHKGDFGKVCVIAGSKGMTGAACMASEAALKTGAGLVTCVVPESLNDIFEVKLTEVMTLPVPDYEGAFRSDSLAPALTFAEGCDVCVLGPGLGREAYTSEFAREFIARYRGALIVDADALYALSGDLSVLDEAESDIIITPHAGEMSRLTGMTTAEIAADRLAAASEFAESHGVTVVLKGAGTVVAHPDGSAAVNTSGSPAMATGGSGDVLAGMLAALRARYDTKTAAESGVFLHGKAGEAAGEKYGTASVTAKDILSSIADVLRK
ncbi:MAG: NAD(P)H-hydrate dehydratase [Abditibacteriota bacterium]|nr:NAD(P)H-hydrate dehydratase [Abditibacteriota bacterium]